LQTLDELIEEKVRRAVDAAVRSIKLPAPQGSRPAVLGSKEAAVYVGLSHARLAKLRELGRGPRYRKQGTKVIYRVEDLDAYLNSLPVFERGVVRS
jgi:hypothetical protein